MDNTGPTITKAAVIIKPDQFTNTTRTQFLEYQNTTALQYFHAQKFSQLIGQCTASEISYEMLPHKGSQHTPGGCEGNHPSLSVYTQPLIPPIPLRPDV